MTVPVLPNEDGPTHRRAIDGNLFYIHPVTDERFISVTTANGWTEHEFLSNRWRPNLTAEAAFAELPRVVAASRRKPCGNTNTRCEHDWQVKCEFCPCGECKACLQKWLANRHYRESQRRAEEGSAMHKWIADWVLSRGQHGPVSPVVEPYIKTFLKFIAEMGLTWESFEMTEATVLNRAAAWGDVAGWGGTLDAQVRFDATATPGALKVCRKFGKRNPLVTLDWKSREGEGANFYSEHAKQLSAYTRGEVILLRDGREIPLPPTDGGMVVQIRPDGYGWRRVVTDDVTYAGFLAGMHNALWEITYGDKATQVKSHPDLPIPDLPEAPKRARKAAPRKATAAQQAADVRALIEAPRIDPAEVLNNPLPLQEPVRAARPGRTLAERVGATRLDNMPAHPDSPRGDSIPF